jgi:hypothetical protein
MVTRVTLGEKSGSGAALRLPIYAVWLGIGLLGWAAEPKSATFQSE